MNSDWTCQTTIAFPLVYPHLATFTTYICVEQGGVPIDDLWEDQAQFFCSP